MSLCLYNKYFGKLPGPDYCGGSSTSSRSSPEIYSRHSWWFSGCQAAWSRLVIVMASKHIKFAPPRPLAESEDTHSLSRWKTNFKNYCKKDPDYVHFLKSTTVWRSDQPNYGFTENVGDKTPDVLEEHVKDFLHLLASYLPHGFLTDKLLKKVYILRLRIQDNRGTLRAPSVSGKLL